MSNSIKEIFFTSIIVIIIILYLSTGVYTLDSGQYAVVMRFGKVVRETTEPGINYHLPIPFEQVKKVRVREVQKVVLEGSHNLGIETFTGDENLILIKVVVGYDVKDVFKYLFNVRDPKNSILAAASMNLSKEVAQRTVDEVMTTGKSVLRLVLKQKIQETLDSLGTGVRVISVELTDIAPPRNVSDAFKAVSDAREKKDRIVKEAEGYANTIIPKARGQADSVVFQAEAYSNEKLNLANARVKAFNALDAEYMKNPDITAKLRYLETIKSIYKKCGVTIDGNPSQSIYYIGKGQQLQIKSNKNANNPKKP